MTLSKQQVLECLKGVNDLAGGGDIVSRGLVRNVAVCEGRVALTLQGIQNADDRAALAEAAAKAVCRLGDALVEWRVDWFEGAAPAPAPKPRVVDQPAPTTSNPLPQVGRVIAVGAGKGGVGKSTISVNLAVGLARRGRRVGLLDGDIYGPSAPTLLGLSDAPPTGVGQVLDPFQAHGIKTMTMGRLVDAEKPLIWRGPMAHGAFKQLALQTNWGTLDEMIVDLPPGTGDVPLTLAQMLPLSGAVIVCTPQRVAQDDAVRAAGMFRQLGVPILGVVENMSYFIGDDGKIYDLFGRGGAQAMAERLKLPFLGAVPINMALRQNSDAGNPTANFEKDDTLAAEFNAVIDALLARLEDDDASAAQPTLTIS